MSSANAAAWQAGAQRAGTGSPLDALFQQFGQLEAQTLLQEFLSALYAGVNPRQIASELSNTIDQLSYGRAETIMRTESLGAWNDAALENYRANSDIIGSWMWVCMPGAGTCVSCLEEDGTIYSLDEELSDHPNGRCCKGPVTSDYGDILSQYGIDASGEDFGPGPWDDRMSGEEWLLTQDAEVQRQAFGSNAAYNAWRTGDAKLADFVGVRHDAVWGDSIYQQSLRGMGLDARDYAAGTAKAAEVAAGAGDLGADALALRVSEGVTGEALDAALTAQIERIAPDATSQEVASFLRQHLPDLQQAQLSALDAEAARLTGNAIANLADALPMVERNLWKVDALAFPQDFENAVARVLADGKTLQLNPTFWNDLRNFALLTTHTADAGWWVATTPEQMIGHEIGHLVQINYRISDAMWESAEARAVAEGGVADLSMYGSTNTQESFAEAFTLLVYGTPTDEQLPLMREMAMLLEDRGIEYNALRASVGSASLDLGS
jgi:hypothetical protein